MVLFMMLYKVALTFTRAPNDPMFPDTPEVPQMVFGMLYKLVWLTWSCPEINLFVGMSQET